MSRTEINAYGQQLTDEEIASGAHRNFVGGLWESIGELQFNFLVKQGLSPAHTLLDVGCGALRGGVRAVRYLDHGNFYGLDLNESLIKAGEIELRNAGLGGKSANLLVNDLFEFSTFNKLFDFAIAVSVFTHLPMNHIVRCLVEMQKVLAPAGCFYATFFEAPHSAYLSSLKHTPGEITTHYDNDPFHYSFEEMEIISNISNLHVTLIGEWDHPRNQRMLKFTKLLS